MNRKAGILSQYKITAIDLFNPMTPTVATVTLSIRVLGCQKLLMTA